MAFYRITIWLEDGTVKTGIREYQYANIDYATDYFTMAAKHRVGVFKDIEVAMLSEQSTAVKAYLNGKRGPNFPGVRG